MVQYSFVTLPSSWLSNYLVAAAAVGTATGFFKFFFYSFVFSFASVSPQNFPDTWPEFVFQHVKGLVTSVETNVKHKTGNDGLI